MYIATQHDFVAPKKLSGPQPEDNHCVNWRAGVFCVGDGCSAPYWEGHPPFIYPDGYTGGQIVTKILRDVFASATSASKLTELGMEANERVWERQKGNQPHKADRNKASTLSTASFACLQLREGDNMVVWGGDIFTVLKTATGKISIVGGDNYACDLRREEIYAQTVRSARTPEEGRKQYFSEIFPRLIDLQDNIEYACLNGQREMTDHWNITKLPDDIVHIALVSDGAWAPIEMWPQNEEMARLFLAALEKGGPDMALKWARGLQNKGIASQRVKRPEATIVAISMD